MRVYAMYLLACGAYFAAVTFAANYLGVNLAEMYQRLAELL